MLELPSFPRRLRSTTTCVRLLELDSRNATHACTRIHTHERNHARTLHRQRAPRQARGASCAILRGAPAEPTAPTAFARRHTPPCAHPAGSTARSMPPAPPPPPLLAPPADIPMHRTQTQPARPRKAVRPSPAPVRPLRVPAPLPLHTIRLADASSRAQALPLPQRGTGRRLRVRRVRGCSARAGAARRRRTGAPIPLHRASAVE